MGQDSPDVGALVGQLNEENAERRQVAFEQLAKHGAWLLWESAETESACSANLEAELLSHLRTALKDPNALARPMLEDLLEGFGQGDRARWAFWEATRWALRIREHAKAWVGPADDLVLAVVERHPFLRKGMEDEIGFALQQNLVLCDIARE